MLFFVLTVDQTDLKKSPDHYSLKAGLLETSQKPQHCVKKEHILMEASSFF